MTFFTIRPTVSTLPTHPQLTVTYMNYVFTHTVLSHPLTLNQISPILQESAQVA